MIPENVQIPGQEEFADDEAIDAWMNSTAYVPLTLLPQPAMTEPCSTREPEVEEEPCIRKPSQDFKADFPL